MRTILAALSVVTLIILLSDCQGKFPERCDHYYDVNCGNLCPEGCPDTCCCGDCEIDTCISKPGFSCEGCCCEENVDCKTDTCKNLPNFDCVGCCCVEGVECKEDTCTADQCYGTWEYTVGGTGDDEGWAIIQTEDNSYVVTGRYHDVGNDNDEIYLLKLFQNGEQDWVINNVYAAQGGTYDEFGADLMELDNGDLVIQGNVLKDASNWQFYIVRADKDGSPKWKQDLFGLSKVDLGYSIVQRTGTSDYLMYGYTGTYEGVSGMESIIYECQSNGTPGTRIPWPEGQYDDYGSCIEVAHDGHYLLLATVGTSTGSKLMLYKLNQDLETLIWEEEIIANCIPNQRACVRIIGDVAAAESEASFVVAGAPVTGAMRITRVSASGQVLDYLSFPGVTITESVSVIPTSDGGFAALSDGMKLVKIKSDFTEEWTREFDGEALGVHSLIQDRGVTGGYVLTGTRSVTGKGKELLIIKTNSEGNVEQP